MESTSSSSNKIEMIQSAIQQLLESRKAQPPSPSTNGDDDDDRHLLSKLLSQLESLKGDVQKPSVAQAESEEAPSSTVSEPETKRKDEADASSRKTGPETEDVVKELKKLGRQNKITHWLLSALMILTVVWQLSEVSILLKVKDGMSHPFRSLGSMVAGVLKAPISDAMESEKQLSSTKQNGTETPLNPEMGLSGLMTNGQE